MRHSCLKHQKETVDYGIKPIGKSYTNGLSREEYTNPWEDNCKMGIVYALHKYHDRNLFPNDICDIIGWKRRSVQLHIESIMKTGILRTSIQQTKLDISTSRGSVVYKLICQPFIDLDFEELKALFYYSFYARHPGCPNIPEQGLLNICDKLYPNMFVFNGAKVFQNRIGSMYPDIKHTKYPIVIEHFGSQFHYAGEDRERIKKLKKMGYFCHVVWDYNVKNRNKVTKEIKEFVDNAIQNIQ